MNSEANVSGNVDHQEIEKFNSIASAWWDQSGEFKPLHLLNPVRVSYIQQKINALSEKHLLDIGCGGGILAEQLAKLGANVTGIDLAEDSLAVAKLHALEQGVKNVSYEKVSAEQHAVACPEQYDVVTCLEMLEHVPDPQSIVKAAVDACKPGGKLFFSTLNKTFKSYLLAIVAAEKMLKLVPDGTHDFEKFIRPADLIRWIESHGVKVRESIGVHYNPLTEQFSIKPGVDVNYILYCEKL
ncbi:bifunctional 2-polyprenyl-6-hydroxyphenol methylase/3-demethylubiquinol 3-O-methyltransferase UbiG [Psychrosphaera ytuae]|uniref:Ubiquinone biosynthesis O-methyltransferase n=1 Tax=Psychrosphaera ytuae TaxID=2820710 RepID=A0A975HIG9_9GAMM|nr:bifunctional 2-polyprenyl-6-hydroxyphenol methylase/3-demethylubiquinol 3-O-methyltransferase UbiG [Psychrosphaera ytuae]QTH64230.1 bifunctional 2-polyprenyl-6-hydroxyphenol methylase/3-demethylubiquinol 3-O-methyltransferase UbiG [Psychrosphaera ytuae]